MTYSIVARDPKSGDFGIAVASRFFAVGALVPHMEGGVGAIATQAFVNPLYGTMGLEMLKSGRGTMEIIDELLEMDQGNHSRQLHLIDHSGQNTAHTGDQCIDWAGHLVADNVSVAGNMLAGPAVVEETLEDYLKNNELPLVERLLSAMEAGENAGGDKRGRQSAALRIVKTESHPWLDLRVDDHADPLPELRRLHEVAGERFLHFAELLPTRNNPSGELDRTDLDRKLEKLEQDRIDEGRLSASYATLPADSVD